MMKMRKLLFPMTMVMLTGGNLLFSSAALAREKSRGHGRSPSKIQQFQLMVQNENKKEKLDSPENQTFTPPPPYKYLFNLLEKYDPSEVSPLALQRKQARWVKMEIPEARCGDGAPYHVYYRTEGKLPHHWTIGFMGGGACWDYTSCYGPFLKTWIHPLPFILDLGGLLSENSKYNEMANYSQLFFPYCTGDIHAGTHEARYGIFSKKVYHWGKINVELALAHLSKLGILDLPHAEQVVLHGSSAGALAAILHMSTIERTINPVAKKILIADSPGLHWGKRFWRKFTGKLKKDYANALEKVGIQFDEHDGLLAPKMETLCQNYPDWQIGILQADKDVVMSSIFGNIDPWKHSQLVLGKDGIYQVLRQHGGNCSSWVPNNYMHTFLITQITSKLKAGAKTAIDYANDLVRGIGGVTYPFSQDPGNMSLFFPQAKAQEGEVDVAGAGSVEDESDDF